MAIQFVKEHWDILTVLIGGAFGFGKTFQEQREMRKDIEEMHQKGVMTKEACTSNQSSCKALQCLKHEQYRKDFIKLTRLIEYVSGKSDKHYEKMLDKIDDTNKRIGELNKRDR